MNSRFWFFPLLFIILPLFYQNCGSDVNLSRMVEVEPVVPLAKPSMEANICSISEESFSLKAKIIFVVDMSLSNLGGRLYPQQCTISHIPYRGGWKHSLGPRENAYDYDGLRFEILRNLTEALGSSSFNNISVMGFHDSAVFGNGLESCQSDFLFKDDALQAINDLNALQISDKNYNSSQCTGSQNSPFHLKGTRYQVALNCMQDKIEYDLLAGTSNEKVYYNILFLTDGEPEDASGNAFVDQLRDLQMRIGPDILGMKLYPIYYGPLGGEEEANAVSVLDPLAQVLDSEIVTQVTSDLPALTENLLDNLISSSTIQHHLRNFTAVNLTAINKNGRLHLDSNMNGLIDTEDETSDGIREIFDSYSNNLNEDKDPYPSFLEKIRGLRTDIADYTLDLDLDGISNGIEIASGRDPFSSETQNPTASDYLVQSQVSLGDINSCSPGVTAYKFKVSQIPLVPDSLGYQDPNPHNGIDFSYSAGENLIMLYYISEPINGESSKKKMYISLRRISSTFTGAINLDTEDFILLGEFE